MTDSPVHKRRYHAFLSHAHADKKIVDALDGWLYKTAGIPVWYDARNLPAGAQIATHLPEAIAQCRALILVLSAASVKSGWVREEYEAAIAQRNRHSDFRIIPVRIETCDVPGFLATTKWVEMPDGVAALPARGQFLSDLYSAEHDTTNTASANDVYVSRTWRDSDRALADRVCRNLIDAGFRLIGDAADQPDFDRNRVQSIMASCGGVAAILPDRGGGKTSSYIVREIGIARELGLPELIVAEPEVTLPADITPIRATASAFDAVAGAIEGFQEEWRPARLPHYSFFATDLSQESEQRNDVVKQLLERVTAMPCLMGEDIREGRVQEVITEKIRRAFFMIADISEENLNTCIEAGIARGAQTRYHLVARAPRRRPPFMFRDEQVFFYTDDADLLATVHRLAYPYRRRVLNWEIATR